MLPEVAVAVAGEVALAGGVAVSGGDETSGGDVGEDVIGVGLAADAQAPTRRVTTMMVATLESDERILCPPDDVWQKDGWPRLLVREEACSRADTVPSYGSMIVVVQRTVLSGAMARMLAEEALPGSGSMARA